MTLDNNYSTINRLTKTFNISQDAISTPRTIVKLLSSEYADGITAGDVIHYDTSTTQFIKSIANSSPNAEVFGIVESRNSDGSIFVVTNGSITISTNRLVNISGANTGGNDIYFLSGTSAGFLQNCGPTFSQFIIKPIYQIAPHGIYTGVVRNYIGYAGSVANTPTPEAGEKVVAFSQDMTKAVVYNPATLSLCVKNCSFSSNVITTSFFIDFQLVTAIPGSDTVDYLGTSNYDVKISNDGLHVMIFAKHTNKIYHLSVKESASDKFKLKKIITVNATGTAEDKLWACDDELTCMTVSTRSLTRLPSDFDHKNTTQNVSSKISYYRRSVATFGDQYRWRKVHENHAFGYCDSKPNSFSGSLVDSLGFTPGIFRTNSLKCTGKNFTISTICLVQDQIAYKSKVTGYHELKYSVLDKTVGITLTTLVTGINGPNVSTTIPSQSPLIFFGNDLTLLRGNSSADTANTRSYKCGYGVKNYRILHKKNNYYYEDFSYRDSSGLEYFALKAHGATFQEFSEYSRKNFINFAPSSILEAPDSTNIDANVSSSCSTNNDLYFAFKYGNEITVFKFPFLSSDGFQSFKYFDFDGTNTVPSPSGYGRILFDSALSLNTFNIFASDSRFFLSDSAKTVVSNGARINTTNFDKANFYNTANGEFFHVDNILHKFNSTQNIFDIVTIG